MSQSPSYLIDKQQLSTLCQAIGVDQPEESAPELELEPPIGAVRFAPPLPAGSTPREQAPDLWSEHTKAAEREPSFAQQLLTQTVPGPERHSLQILELMDQIARELSMSAQPSIGSLSQRLGQLADMCDATSAFIADAVGLPLLNDMAEEEHVVLSASFHRALESVRFEQQRPGQFIIAQVNDQLVLHLFWVIHGATTFAVGLTCEEVMPLSYINNLKLALIRAAQAYEEELENS